MERETDVRGIFARLYRASGVSMASLAATKMSTCNQMDDSLNYEYPVSNTHFIMHIITAAKRPSVTDELALLQSPRATQLSFTFITVIKRPLIMCHV